MSVEADFSSLRAITSRYWPAARKSSIALVPAGNSVAAHNLIFLAAAKSQPEYLPLARKTIAATLGLTQDSPAAAPRMMTAIPASSRECRDARSHVPPVDEHSGLTLAAALKRLLPDRSWSQVQKLIASRHVQVNGNLCLDPERKVKAGDVMKILEQSLCAAGRRRRRAAGLCR